MSHPSHKTRLSDSSLYMEVCTACGANDGRGTSTRLDKPCPDAAAADIKPVHQYTGPHHSTVLIPGPHNSFLMVDHVKAGQYRFPGGTMEPGEMPMACAVRELLEELGIEATALELIRELTHFVSGKDWHGHYYLCSKYRGTPRIMEPTKHRGFQYKTLLDMELGTHNSTVHKSDYETAYKYHFPRG
jgi:8-oxo-dGTP diphosphatase